MWIDNGRENQNIKYIQCKNIAKGSIAEKDLDVATSNAT